MHIFKNCIGRLYLIGLSAKLGFLFLLISIYFVFSLLTTSPAFIDFSFHCDRSLLGPFLSLQTDQHHQHMRNNVISLAVFLLGSC